MRNLALSLFALPLAACMTTGNPPTGSLDAAPPPAAGATCDATEAQQFIGRQASEAIGRSALAMSGARTMRWGGPDTAFTMDFREDRLNIVYDAGGSIERIYCG
ncbi:I78 family peptidase inhibitor [Erythrobacter litoralis]|uniref:I78 family peptidase inhibitor n=1 Tax=Erythrobacter litoralis TaxID=39960 RepID=UPI002434CFB2|nr:I78 family peptidase inhibitor [Erythrobacter litoralis]